MSTYWIHDTAVVLGQVTLGDDVSVWPNAVIRGDVERVEIGARTNVQDGAVIHCDPGVPALIGDDCVIGHRAIVHGCTLESGVLVGMGAVVLNHAHIGTGSIIGAGAVVKEGTRIPPNSLVVGIPAKVIRTVDDAQRASTIENAARYSALKEAHRAGTFPRIR